MALTSGIRARLKTLGKLSMRLKTLDELKLYLTKSLVSGKGWLLGTFGIAKIREMDGQKEDS